MGFDVKVLADSMSPRGHRLTTLELTYPRIIHAEMMTHRVFSRNSASSRAIPVEKLIQKVLDDPFIPIYWGKNQKGMQALEELGEQDATVSEVYWLQARDKAVEMARSMAKINVHKQIVNRLLEPFQWYTAIFSGTEWNNFLALRCHPDAQPEIQALAKMVRTTLNTHNPVYVGRHGWHMPITPDIEDLQREFNFDQAKRISIGRCARVSYLTHMGSRDPRADLELCDRLISSGHMCYDEDTEVLTLEGWKKWPEVSKKDKLLAVDFSTGTSSFEVPKALHIYSYDKKLLHLSGSQLDLMVTPNHLMVTRYRKNGGAKSAFTLDKAEELVNKPKYYLKSSSYTGDNSYDKHFPSLSLNFFRLLGFFVGDGSAKSYSLRFNLRKSRKIEYLKSICHEIVETSPGRFTLHNKEIREWFKANCYDSRGYKKLPLETIHLTKDKVEAILEGLKNSDGHIKRNTWTYHTNSKQVADTLQILLHLSNRVGNLRELELENGNPFFRLNVSHSIDPLVASKTDYRWNEVSYRGKVYCATVSTGALMVRRNNKVAVCGNSPTEHVATPAGDDEFYGNYRGWIQYRKSILHEDDFGKHFFSPSLGGQENLEGNGTPPGT